MLESFFFETYLWQRSAPVSELREVVDAYVARCFERGEQIEVGRIAQTIGISRFRFTREFKADVGVAPLVYVRFRQVERARLLLETTDDALDRVALYSGCGSTRALHRLFEGEPTTPAASRRKP